MNRIRFWNRSALVALLWTMVLSSPLSAQKKAKVAKKVDYAKRVAPILRKYCAACHNPDEAAGKLLLNSYAGMLKGGKNGAVITPGRSDLSRMIRLITGKDKPQMPPKDNERPTAGELAVLVNWINAGAPGPSGKSLDPTVLITPRIKPTGPVKKRVNAIAISKDGVYVAIARYGRVEIEDLTKKKRKSQSITGLRGNVNSVTFSPDSRYVITAAGEAGLFGEARIWDLQTRKATVFQGHRDSLYSAVVSPNGKWLATGSYDTTIRLWNVATGQQVRVIRGHNGPVYELAFHPRGHVLASASGDRTVKLWDVKTGKRLDTLNQSLKELYCVAFSHDGTKVIAGGVDNRIRVWRVSASAKAGTNPLLASVFAHDEAILKLAMSVDGRLLFSAAEDRRVKVWNFKDMSLRAQLPRQADWVTSLAVSKKEPFLFVGRLDGGATRYRVDFGQASGDRQQPIEDVVSTVRYGQQPEIAKLPKSAEKEPNDSAKQAQPIKTPITVTGKIYRAGNKPDADLFRFAAKASSQWIVEVNAAKSKSKLDSKIEILDSQGQKVQRVLLRAVRDSEVTFRGINSDQTGCRVTNWQEMLLNQYLYINGEVVRLWRMPRGPDSGFEFYPGSGKRTGFFDTSARTHPVGAQCYIVEPHRPGTKLPDNGLPTFPVYFENDDDSRRKSGDDSRLTFVAPADGQYLVRISDVRRFSGKHFHYKLSIRRPSPDFRVSLSGGNQTIAAGSGKAISVRVERSDNFKGPVQVDISGLPAGFQVTTPLVIQPGQLAAKGVVSALPQAHQVAKSEWDKVKVVASAMIAGKKTEHKLSNLGFIKLGKRPKLIAHLERDKGSHRPSFGQPWRKWEVLKPTLTKSRGGATLKTLADKSVLASGKNPDNDVYELVFTAKQTRKLRGLRIEALGDKSLPSGAPGRADKNGSFVLTEIDVQTGGKPVKLAWAEADYSQSGFDVSQATDGKPKTGWAIAKKEKKGFVVPRVNKIANKTAWFEFAKPVQIAKGQKFIVRLHHASSSKRHNMGRFRISTTTDVRPKLRFAPVATVVIEPGRMAACRLRVERFGFGGRISFDVQNLPHGVIVDDIGLSGVLIPEGETERTIFLNAQSWVPETDRLFHAVANVDGNQVSLPMLLKVRRKKVAQGR